MTAHQTPTPTTHHAPAADHVVVVEDDTKIAALLRDYLLAAGYTVSLVHDGLLAVAEIRQRQPAAVLLDLMLPGMDGLAICRAVRAFSDVPVLMLTARVDEVDRLLGLDTGADDYVCKPFSPREVVARVAAQVRRAQGRLRPSNIEPHWQVDDAGQRVAWRSQWLTLTPQEFRLLRVLLQQPGRVFARARLLDALGTDTLDVSDRAIDSHIKNIRRKLTAADAAAGERITSVYGVGYRFEA